MTYRLLDLFCCAGGAGTGYHRAGFEVVGIDINPQKHYPFEFHQADALEYLADHGHEFDAIHASPPCQAYSRTAGLTTQNYPKLIGPVRDMLIKSARPYVIENVPGAPLVNPAVLCGSMFNLITYRHRLFETSFCIFSPPHPDHVLQSDKLSGPDRRRDMVTVVGKGQYKGANARYREAMQIDWMNESEITEAIPPAYTEFIGRQLIQWIEAQS